MMLCLHQQIAAHPQVNEHGIGREIQQQVFSPPADIPNFLAGDARFEFTG
jgi:hypothetical protein